MRKNFKIGPGAASLMLVIVVVALSLLALLAFIEVHGDIKLTRRSIDFAVAEYEASAQAEYRLAELDAVLVNCAEVSENEAAYIANVEAALPEGMTMTDGVVYWEQPTPEGRVLMCAVEVLPMDSDVRYQWLEHIFVSNSGM